MERPIVWAEVDIEAVAHNTRALRRITRNTAHLMAVVKADGYGHGAVEVAQTALASGASRLGVARIGEAIALRKAGLEAPILIFGYTLPQSASSLINYDLTQSVYNYETARAYAAAAAAAGKKIKVHLKIDTGMGRLGLVPSVDRQSGLNKEKEARIFKTTEAIVRLPGLEAEGVYTHFSTADSADKAYAGQQLDTFLACLERFRRGRIQFKLRHAANSAAVIELPDSHLDMVRPGIALYGLYPSAEVVRDRAPLTPAMTLKAIIVHLKRVPAGFNISYGNTYQTSRATTIATVPVGYADGYSRLFSNRGQMLVNGSLAPVVGRVCMDHTMLDVGHIADISMEDEVVVFGGQHNQRASADQLAATLGTINYEIVSAILARVQRVYLSPPP